MEDDITTSLRQALESCQREALDKFLQKLIPVLKQCNLGPEDLIEALATYFFTQGNWGHVVKLLEEVSREIRRHRRIHL